MEKITVFVVVLLLTAFCVSAETTAPVPVTVAAAAAVTDTANKEETLMDVRLKQLYLNITPELQFVLPDASLKLGLKQKIGDTMLDASTEYNYLYNKIRYDISYSIDVFLTLAVNLYDAVSFEQVYKNDKYIQRNKGLGFSVGTPKIFNFLSLREEIKNDNYYFARLDNSFSPETGNILISDSWIEFDLNFDDKTEKSVNRIAFNFDKSIPSKMSGIDFLFLNVYADKKFIFEDTRILTLKYEGGFLLDGIELPTWKLYRLGGYERMMGFNYDEFEGYFKEFLRVKIEAPVVERINWEFFWIRFDTIRVFAAFDTGSTGGGHEVGKIDHYNYSAGLGLIIEFTFRKNTPIKMTFAAAQAIKQGKLPVFYFVNEF